MIMVQAAFRSRPDDSPGHAGTYVVLVVALGLAVGCSGRPPLEEINFSPAEVAQQAIRKYDKNGDGVLDARELEQCPALLGLLNELDGKEEKNSQHKSGVLRGDEIQQRLEAFQASHVPLVGVTCRVFLDGEPLEGAAVTLVPEEFMGAAFKRVNGVSNAQGVVRLVTEGKEVPGVAFGYYGIEVSKKDAGDRETLPAQYNQRTTLGREVSPLRRGGMIIKLELSSS